jgi:hypothetical protein
MDEQPKVTKKRMRSSAYPAFTLEQAIEATKELREKLGKGPYSRDDAARSLGYSGVTGVSAGKIASLVHFGLLQRKGSAYYQSELADHIFLYRSDEERDSGIKRALNNPTLYKRLISAYEGQALPTMLENILSRQYGIQEKVAKAAANTFKKSAQYAGILVNGVLVKEGISGPVTERRHDDETGSTSGLREPSALTNQPQLQQGKTTSVPVLDTGILVVFPERFVRDLSLGKFSKGIERLEKDVGELDSKPAAQPIEDLASEHDNEKGVKN